MGFLKLIRWAALFLAGYVVVRLLRQLGTRSDVERDAARQGRKFVKSKIKDEEP